MIKKRQAKNKSLRRGDEGTSEVVSEEVPMKVVGEQEVEPVSEQDVIQEVLNTKARTTVASVKHFSYAKTNVLNLMNMYGDEEEDIVMPDSKIIQVSKKTNTKSMDEMDDGISYQPKSKRTVKQNKTFSTSDMRKRKRPTVVNADHPDILDGGIESDLVKTSHSTEIVSVDEHNFPHFEDEEIVPMLASDSNIPDDITIQAIKMKRKKLREQQPPLAAPSDDYIPLDASIPEKAGLGYKAQNQDDNLYTRAIVTKNGDVVLHKIAQSDSRLVREDDEIEDAVDEIVNRDEEVFETWKTSKIQFGLPDDDRNKGNTRETLGNVEIEEDEAIDEEDEEKNEEFQSFELDQLRRAGIKIPERKQIITQSNLFKTQEEIEIEEDHKAQEENLINASLLKFSSKKEGERAIESFEVVQKRLLERMSELEISHEQSQKHLLGINSELETVALNLSHLNEDTEHYDEQYKYFQEMNRFVDNLADLLDTIVPEMDMIESQILELQERYYRQCYEKSFHGHVSFMSGYRETQRERASSFGGDGSIELSEERYFSEMYDLVEKMKHLLDEADDQYVNLSLLKERFEDWKVKYPTYYKDTYCSMCLHNAFAVFVRLELLSSGCEYQVTIRPSEKETTTVTLPMWCINPLNCTDFTLFNFWKTLFNYGEVSSESMEEETLFPNLIRKTMLSFVLHALSNVYNPLVVEQTTKAIQLVKEFQVYLEGSQKLEEAKLCETIEKRLCTTIHDYKFPTNTQNLELVEKYFMEALSFLSNSVLPWMDLFPSLRDSEDLKHGMVTQIINTKMASFLDHSVTNNYITKKDRIRLLTKIIQCKIPNHWKPLMNLSIDY